MSEWNFDMEAAPLGYYLTDEKPKQYQVEHLWLAMPDGTVKKSFWDPTANDGPWWRGINKGDQPTAWQRFVVPAHPNATAS